MVTEPLVRVLESISSSWSDFHNFDVSQVGQLSILISDAKVDGIHSVERFVGDLFSPIFGGPVASGSNDKVRYFISFDKEYMFQIQSGQVNILGQKKCFALRRIKRIIFVSFSLTHLHLLM